MERKLEKTNSFFNIPLRLQSRILIFLGVLFVLPALVLPLWEMRIHTGEFPDGLSLKIFASKFEGAVVGNREDILEINALNHFIGMRSLEEEDFVEFRWMPFALGIVILLGLRVIVFGTMAKLIDLFVFYAYFGLFALWSFYEKLYAYGHNLNPYAVLKVAPFTPPMFGHEKVGNFDLYGAPEIGSYFLLLVPFLLAGAICISYRAWRRANLPSRDYVSGGSIKRDAG
ncbi:MAG TPA: hypothetical protein VNN76_07640 [Bacteroidota bacterium]|nr:hypothetical protein [Bacteroidota bacterium]